MTRKWTANRSATERLAHAVKTALADQNRAGEEVAREARLPSKVFQSLLRHGRDQASIGRTRFAGPSASR